MVIPIFSRFVPLFVGVSCRMPLRCFPKEHSGEEGTMLHGDSESHASGNDDSGDG